jgi:hypothetical protein
LVERDADERDVLPYFKDPKIKISFWTILADAIGKDLSKIGVPIYFNAPLNVLQSICCAMESNYILDKALMETDSVRRLTLVTVYSAILLNAIERNKSKPFNPLLGETFEYVTDTYSFLGEQVSHHPPITVFETIGKAGYRVWTTDMSKAKFTGKSLNVTQPCKFYIEFPKWGEVFEIASPVLSIHNLIIGQMYLDLGGKGYIRSVHND